MTFLQEVEEEYNKFSKMEKEEYHRGYKEGNLDSVKNPNVALLVQRVQKWEGEQMNKKPETVVKSPLTTTGDGPVQEAVIVIPEESRVMASKSQMTLQETIELAGVLHKSRYFKDVGNAEQAVAKILAGRELGFGPIVSISKVYIVNEKIGLESGLIGSLIRKGGVYDWMIKRLDDEGCILDFYKNGRFVGQSSFLKKDAIKAELLNKGVWKKYARNMYFARALSNGGRWYAPEKIYNAYTYEELNIDVSSGAIGDMPKINITGKPAELPAATPPVPTKEDKRRDELEVLKKKHGVAKIKEVKKSLKISAKLIEASDEDYKKFKEALEDKKKPEKKAEEKPEKTRKEILQDIKNEYSVKKMKVIKEELKIEGKVIDVDDKTFKKYVEAFKEKK